MSQQETEPPERTRLTRHEILDLVQRHFATELSGDVDGMLATMTPEQPGFTSYPGGEKVLGQSALRERYFKVLPFFESVESEQKRVWVDEERQDVVIEFHGRIKKPNGDPVEFEMLVMFEIEDGLIRHETTFSSLVEADLLAD